MRSSLKDRLRSRLDQLRCMTPKEMAQRALRGLRARMEKASAGEPTGGRAAPAPDLSAPARFFIHGNATIEPEGYAAAAKRVAEGWLDVFALRELDLGSPPRWNRDCKTGIEAPLAFGKTLDCTDPDLVGDIKYLWEPNRHQHLVTLAQAFSFTRQKSYFDVIAEQLDSWFLACPYPLGPNWASAHEAAIRLINWSVAWQLLFASQSEIFDTRETSDFKSRWLSSIYRHAQFIRGWFSLHASASDQLIGEAAGLYVASITWPYWPEARRWRAASKQILEREALAQSTPDGVNREQAVCHQQRLLEFLLLALLAGRANGEKFSAPFEARLEAMLDYLASIMDAGGNMPMFGDADDAMVSRLDPAAKRGDEYRSLLATGAILFRRGDFKLKAGRLDDKTRWLLGPAAEPAFAALDSQMTRLPQRQQFAEGGYYILGAEFDSPQEIRVVADAGALGARPVAAHGHADALSFTLSAGGREFLVDPGTYAYHTQARWRSYFRGTGAHNTVRIDGLDQSEPAGGFVWLRKARAGCSLWLSSAQRDSFEGWHDGYMRLPDPVKHRRMIELDKIARRIVVEDTLEMAEEHDIELIFHCSDKCSVASLPDGVAIAQGSDALEMKLPSAEGSAVEVYTGSVQPPFGWISREFDRRRPAPTIVWRARIAGNTVLRTEILVPAGGDA